MKKVFAHSDANGLTIISSGEGNDYALIPLKKRLLRPHFAHVLGSGFQTTGGG